MNKKHKAKIEELLTDIKGRVVHFKNHDVTVTEYFWTNKAVLSDEDDDYELTVNTRERKVPFIFIEYYKAEQFLSKINRVCELENIIMNPDYTPGTEEAANTLIELADIMIHQPNPVEEYIPLMERENSIEGKGNSTLKEAIMKRIEEAVTITNSNNDKKQTIMEETTVVPVKENKEIALSASAQELRTILLDNIESIKKDSAFIHQAKAINNSVQTYLNVIRTEMECIKLTKEING